MQKSKTKGKTNNSNNSREDLERTPKYLIAGIDAGVTTAFALLDLSGNLVYAESSKNTDDEKIIGRMASHGRIVLVASDTSPPSHFVKKISSRLGVKLYHPKSSLTQEEKRRIGKSITDPHIRDAYAAAVKAYHRYENRLRRLTKLGVDDRRKIRIMMGKRAKIKR